MSTVALVVNPTAGRGRGRTAGARTAEALHAAGHAVVDLSAPSLPLAQESADAAVRGTDGTDRPGVDALVVVGGDGMVHLGVNATAGTGVPLGIVAVGTGNDFAHALGLPTTRVDRCVDALLAALGTTASATPAVRAVDAARVTGAHLAGPRWYAGVLSAGIDAAVNAHANAATWPRGRSRYARSALTEITRYRPYGYRVTLRGVPAGDELPDLLAGAPLLRDGAAVGTSPDPDGRDAHGGRTVVWESPGALVAVANGPRIGGGIRIAPGATLDDGLLDVVVAGPFGRWGAARIFPGMYAGRHLANPGVGTLRATSVTVAATEAGATPPHAFADGEHLGPLPLRVDVVPGALHVLQVGAGP
ncbi:diacylglycerol/lipid kinase family protein [Cellulosimicrobium protaetiae]|uniref:Diacylglycerol kinase family lipid kinase n=1 Tax=Cellulosimicrobium protaetiae TaxID=2587808 RepID=A0A6M5UHS9_9MICO|nr:diacylglycerol kinase family protein [Cellulosimicrobium protaetiae]QJW36801.1 diacylglycerol kinase family lipid kinase [Cellulosimicrobium protaetiae]